MKIQVISEVFWELLPSNKLNWDDFTSKVIGIYKEQIFSPVLYKLFHSKEKGILT